MANLRANKITTGTADYQGSIYANGVNAYLRTTVTAPGTDDFTIECWINSDAASSGTQEGVFGINAQPGGFQSGSSNQIRLAQGRDGAGGQNGGLEITLNGTYVGTPDGEDIIQEGTWHHIAVTRASGTVKIWVDGVEKASGSAAGDVTGTTFVTGYYDGNYTYQGYMSNFRYRKGTAYYTTTFTPPTGPLERTSDTELLFAQSVNNAGDGYSSAIHGGTTNIMQVFGNVTANTSAPTLTTSSSVGVVFDGDIKMNSQGYMYFPTGDTSQRGGYSGRMIVGGGEVNASPGTTNVIEYLNFAQFSNAVDFGDLTQARRKLSSCSSSTRGIWAGGGSPGSTDVIDYVTIATTGNAADFGNLATGVSDDSSQCFGGSNNTRGIFAGGYNNVNTIQYITIATTADAQDFGDLISGRFDHAGFASPTRVIFAGGKITPTGNYNSIEYVTIATTGNGTDFGDMTAAVRGPAGLSNNIRGLMAGGSGVTNSIEYLTIASTGRAKDFGDLLVAHQEILAGGSSNNTRGVWAGGQNPGQSSMLQSVMIQSMGNAIDWSNLTTGTSGAGAASDSHGGLS